MLKIKIRIFYFLIIALLLVACHSSEKKSKTATQITVTPKKEVVHLYYNGLIRPLQEELIAAPASGIVKKVNFHYGDIVKQGQLLFTIHSPELENDFRETMSQYLRAKQAYVNSQTNMQGTEDLHKEKIISEQEYANEKNQLQTNLLSYIEASNKLQQLLKNIPQAQKTIRDVSLSNMDKVKQLLTQQFEDLAIYAQNSGIILFPDKSDGDSNKEIHVGNEIKKGQVALVLGDLSGLTINADVSEMDIHRVRPGQRVKVSFTAQPDLLLQGMIVSVAKQAKSVENNAMTSFPVVIQVASLSEDQLEKIRIGMNAKVDIAIVEPPLIKIPINAVFQKAGRNWVYRINPEKGNKEEVEVETGTTTLDEVTILHGLTNGDKVILDD